MKLASKSKNRIAILDMVQDGISTQNLFEVLDFKDKTEDKINWLRIFTLWVPQTDLI